MAFDWIGDGGTRSHGGRATSLAAIAAIALTVAMIGAVSTSFRTRIIDVGHAMLDRAETMNERLTFAIAIRSPTPSTRPKGSLRDALPADDERPESQTDTAARAAAAPEGARRSEAGRRPLDQRPIDLRLRVPPARYRVELRLPTYDVSRAFTPEQRDSVLAHLKMNLPVLVADLKPTQEMLDSAARAKASMAAFYRDQVRPMPVPLGGMSVGLFGKSREERRRDSIVHSDNLDRLERLVARLRAKQDSARRADSIAALKTQKVDSTDE